MRLLPIDDPGEPLGVAVSGGSDSLALLYLLTAERGSNLICATVNHGLRQEAAEEARHVARTCEELGVPHYTLNWRGWDGKGNLQDQARRARYALLTEWAVSEGCRTVALGHTRDDVAETFLMRLARASGVDGLAMMSPSFRTGGVTFIRPLLDCSREDLREYLTSRNKSWVEDPSNADLAFERARLRHALPQLAELGLSVEALSETAGHLREASEALSHVARQWCEEHADTSTGDVLLDREAILTCPKELRRRIFARSLQWVGSTEYPARGEAIARILGMVEEACEPCKATLSGCHVLTGARTVRITREFAAVGSLASPTDQAWDTRWKLSSSGARGDRIKALGEAITLCPEWRKTGLPRQTLMSSPSVWQGDELVSAPLAGLKGGWTLHVPEKEQFLNLFVPH